MSENLVGNNNGKKKDRYSRHRDKYSGEYNSFDLKSKSQIRNGFVRDRACTDMFCAVALVVCSLAFFGVAGYALASGSVERIFSGVDGDHNVCGQKGTKTANYPYLLVVPYPTLGVVLV
jgi:hypothetical protein